MNLSTAIIEELEQRCVQLEQENARLKEQNAELTANLNWFMEQFKLAQHRQFGSSSELTSQPEQQVSLFNEAEKEADPEPTEPTETINSYTRRKRRGHREAMLKDLPVETIE